jgi:ankyrin repeat protein
MSCTNFIRCEFLVVLALVANAACNTDVGQTKPTPANAAIYDDTEQMREFIDQGLNVNVQNKYGHTLLHIASMEGSVDVVQLLLREGALLEVKDDNGDTALYHAAGTDRFEVAKILLEAGADPNVVGQLGSCPLTVAIAENNLEVARLLREYAAKECN